MANFRAEMSPAREWGIGGANDWSMELLVASNEGTIPMGLTGSQQQLAGKPSYSYARQHE